MSKIETSRLLPDEVESEADEGGVRNVAFSSYNCPDEDIFDGGVHRLYSDDDYEATLPRDQRQLGKAAKTGRQRRKQVARSKALPATSKRRVSVSRLPFDIKTDELFDNIESAQYRDWRRFLYNGEVIRLFKDGTSPDATSRERKRSTAREELLLSDEDDDALDEGIFDMGAKEVFIFDFGVAVFWGFPVGGTEEKSFISTIKKFGVKKSNSSDDLARTSGHGHLAESKSSSDWLSLGLAGSQARSVESLSSSSYERIPAVTGGDDADDDMAFLLDRTLSRTKVKNDIIFLHKDSAKERLALSYGIAQSAILAVFESRVDDAMESTKWIPETLAQTGKCHIKESQLGRMIGAVFVIRHEVNLYSDILDIPDFFWNEDIYEPEYRNMTSYLEIDHRVQVLNTRVDMLRELLQVLQAQQENAHGTNLELIVIWLIVAEVVLQLLDMWY